jgi:hypothetical protein
MCHESKLAKICASFSGQSWPCFMTFVPFCLSRCLWIGSFDLEKVAAAFPAMIGGKKGLQDHIIASLTYIIANFRRSTIILDEISAVFCARPKRRGYESIWDSGEDMRWKNHHWLIHSSSTPWRRYAPEVAKLCSF